MFRVKEKAGIGCKAKENWNGTKLNRFVCGKPYPTREYVCHRSGHGRVKIHAAYPKESNCEAGKPVHRTAWYASRDNQSIML